MVQAVLKQLNFLTAFERNKILGVVSEITSTEELKNNINEIMDFAETLQDVTARKNISENIQKELMATKNIRKTAKHTVNMIIQPINYLINCGKLIN